MRFRCSGRKAQQHRCAPECALNDNEPERQISKGKRRPIDAGAKAQLYEQTERQQAREVATIRCQGP